MSQDILTENLEGVLTIHLNKPNVYNALSKENKKQLQTIIEKSADNKDTKTIILTSNGKAFCSGQDLNNRSNLNNANLGETLKKEWNPLIQSFINCPKIIIAAIDGVCAGAGISMAMACDLIIAKKSAKFVSGFCKIGLVPDCGSTYALSRALGKQKACEFFLFNNSLTAQDLYDANLINYLSDESSLDKATSMAKQICNMAPMAVSHLKKNLQIAFDRPLNEAILAETKSQEYLGKSHDYKEGVQAFFDKRAPEFKGY